MARATSKTSGKRATPAKKAVVKRSPAKGTRSKARPAASARRGASKAVPAPAAPPIWAWHEVVTGDVGGAKAFYTTLFGWKAAEVSMPTGPYVMFTKGAQQVAGCMAIPLADGKPVCPPHWLAYVCVDDVDATVARARELGARVDVPGMDVPGVGRFAVLGDPTGATFAVFRG